MIRTSQRLIRFPSPGSPQHFVCTSHCSTLYVVLQLCYVRFPSKRLWAPQGQGLCASQ